MAVAFKRLRAIPTQKWSRCILEYPWKATLRQLYEEGEGLHESWGLRTFVYGKRFSVWTWIQTVTKTGKYIGAMR